VTIVDQNSEVASSCIAHDGTYNKSAGVTFCSPAAVLLFARGDRAGILAAGLESVTFRQMSVTWAERYHGN
jgi:hypothetical protein